MAMVSVDVELVTVAVALELTDESAALVAVIVMAFRLVVVGAVHRPEAEMLPAVADHTTAVLLVFLTLAWNCTLPPTVTDGSVGDT